MRRARLHIRRRREVPECGEAGEEVSGWAAGRVALGVDDNMLIIADVADHLRVGDDLEGEALICASLSPLGRGADGVAVNEQGRGEALQIGGQVNGRRGFADAAFVACDRDYHLFVYAEW